MKQNIFIFLRKYHVKEVRFSGSFTQITRNGNMEYKGKKTKKKGRKERKKKGK